MWKFPTPEYSLHHNDRSVIFFYTVNVRNLRTGETFTEMADPTGYFAAASADLTRKAIVKAGDKLEVSVVDSNGELASGPFVHEVTLEGIRNALLDV